jgi:hypothetical protein
MKMNRHALRASALLGAALLTSCGGGGGNSAATPPAPAATVLTGTTYPVMAGLNYRTATQSGVTGSDGSYRYKAGEQVTFSVADIELGSVRAAAEATPLDLDNDSAASNMLRMVKVLDADSNLSNGVVFPTLPATGVTPIDFTDAAAVARALAQIDPVATLPAATDAQVVSALASAKSKAAATPATYGAAYKSFDLSRASHCTAGPTAPATLLVNFSGQPNWVSGLMAGEITLTLQNGSEVKFPFASSAGTSAQGYGYTLSRGPAATDGRVIQLRTRTPGIAAICDLTIVYLRDETQPNLPPYAISGVAQVQIPVLGSGKYVYTYADAQPTGPGIVTAGSKDLDGRIVSQEWSASDGSTGTGSFFSVSFGMFSEVTITLTATDDEGAKTVKTWTLGNAKKSLAAVLELLATNYYVTRVGGFSTYYRVDLSRTKVSEFECDDIAKSCTETVFNLADVDTKAFLEGLSMNGRGQFLYVDPQDGATSLFVQADTLPSGYHVQRSDGTSRDTADSGSGSMPGGTQNANPVDPAACSAANSAPVLGTPPAACYKGREYTFGWGDTQVFACQGATNNPDLAFYNAQQRSGCYCKKDATVNSVAAPYVCYVFFDVGP